MYGQEDPHNAHPNNYSDRPSISDDHPAIRNAYIRVFLGVAFDKMTHQSAKRMLQGFQQSFAAGAEQGAQFDGLENFALTIQTVEKRLGVSTEGFIIYLFICPVCWAVHYPDELLTLASPTCAKPTCNGQLFTTKRRADRTEKRVPALTLPYVRPSTAIARMCLQPGKVEQWQRWRREEDTPGRTSPSLAKGYDSFEDPTKPMYDVTDGWRWRAVMAGLQRQRDGVWNVDDVDVRGLNQRFVSLPNGLMLQINIDWFQAVKGGCHSTGALYMTILNNPRSIRYLRESTQLTAVFPGPHEPTIEQQNNIMAIVVEDLHHLYDGIVLPVHGGREAVVHGQLFMDVSDLPASRKTNGLAGPTSNYHLCPNCHATMFSLTSSGCFDSSEFVERDEWRHLKYSLRAKDAGPELQQEILDRRGVRYSVLNEVPGWYPGISNVVDFMHCAYLGMTKHICKNILLKTGMIDTRASTAMEEWYSTLIWPPSVSRMPPSISRGAGSIKADNWKAQLAILSVSLFVAWQVDGRIPDGDAPLPASNTNNAKALLAQQRLVHKRMVSNFRVQNPNATIDDEPRLEHAKMDRSYRRHYDAIVQFCAALRILPSYAISPDDVKRGCDMLARSMQSWARMHCHLTPYCHFAMHMEEQYYAYGPCAGWWTFPYERNNGYLGCFNLNGHSGGELECTMMRGWWRTSFIHDLILHVESMPQPRHHLDDDSIEQLKSCLRGNLGERRGSQQAYEARLDRKGDDARLEGLFNGKFYEPVFALLRDLWADQGVELIRDTTLATSATQSTFIGKVRSFSHIWLDTQRHGAATATRGHSAKYAYIDSRIPVIIEYIFAAEHTSAGPLRQVLAVVSRFMGDHETARLTFPWDLWATDLGIRVWRAGRFAPAEVITIERLSGHFVLAPLSLRGLDIWITIAYDQACINAPACSPALLISRCRKHQKWTLRKTASRVHSAPRVWTPGLYFDAIYTSVNGCLLILVITIRPFRLTDINTVRIFLFIATLLI
ncbi:hypothetical protein EV715DRAFT_210517 [Schizophyllum commune]